MVVVRVRILLNLLPLQILLLVVQILPLASHLQHLLAKHIPPLAAAARQHSLYQLAPDVLGREQVGLEEQHALAFAQGFGEGLDLGLSYGHIGQNCR